MTQVAVIMMIIVLNAMIKIKRNVHNVLMDLDLILTENVLKHAKIQIAMNVKMILQLCSNLVRGGFSEYPV